jgi:CDP-glycerol glycerophosphotransferase
VTRISVVVPIYNVEDYLASCLRSVEAQTYGDLEVVMVDDGSTDGSADIAAGFARRDPRFRLVSQENGGLSRARNTGIDAARGELLAFLDSDDVLPADAYERLVGALDETGSDFATGNVHRLDGSDTRQAAFLARTFARTRLRTHVMRFRPLLADRTAWNKLFRRTFWDRHGFRFPEGRIHEDIPVTIPAHFSAASVDVIAEPVYYWRVRHSGGDLSITQRRLEKRALLDRLAAIEEVRDHLVEHGPRRGLRWYERSAIADDLRLHLNVLDQADDAYRELFLDRAGAFVERAGWGVLRSLPAIDRLKWELVRRRRMPDLLEVLRFQREDLGSTPPVRIRGRWYGDYPFRDELPSTIYRLRREDLDLAPTAHIEALRRDDERVVLRGRAAIDAVGPGEPQRVTLLAVRPGRWQRLRSRIAATRLPTTTRGRAFEATLDPRAVGRRDGDWELSVHVRAGGLSRRRSRFVIEVPRPQSAVNVRLGDALLTVAATAWGKLVVQVRSEWVAITDHRVAGETLQLEGELKGTADVLELRRESDALTHAVPIAAAGGRWLAEVALADLDQTVWELWAVGGGRRIPLSLLGEAGDVLTRTRRGGAAVSSPAPRTAARSGSGRSAGSRPAA